MGKIETLRIKNPEESMKEKLKENFKKKIEEWKKNYFEINDENRLSAAKNLAYLLHDWTGIIRINSAEEYMLGHVEKVVALVDDDAKVVAYLHDTLEDTGEMFKEYMEGDSLNDFIKNNFGEGIFNMVSSLTENKELREKYNKKIDKKYGSEVNLTEEEISDLEKNKKIELKIAMLDNSIENINILPEKDRKKAAQVRIADLIGNLIDYDKQNLTMQRSNLEKANILYQEFKKDIDLAQKLKDRIDEIEGSMEESDLVQAA